MQLALMTEPQLGMTYETLLDLARFAEDAGLDAFARSDHYSFSGIDRPHATDALATLAGLARETSRIELVVLVSPSRSASCGDRQDGGDDRRDVEGTLRTRHRHRVDGTRAPDLWDPVLRSTRTVRPDGGGAHLPPPRLRQTRGRFPGHVLLPRSGRDPPRPANLRIIIGGSGERRTPRLAGTFADEYNFVFRPAADMALRIERARDAAKAPGDPDKLAISVMTPVITGENQADYERTLARIAAADPWQRTAEELATRYRDRGLPIGTATEVRNTVSALADLGVSRLYVQHFGPYERDLLGEIFEVLRAEGSRWQMDGSICNLQAAVHHQRSHRNLFWYPHLPPYPPLP